MSCAGSFRFENSRVRGSGTASPADVDAALSALAGRCLSAGDLLCAWLPWVPQMHSKVT